MSKFIEVTLESNRERVAINADQIIFIEDGMYSPSKLNMIGGQSFIVLESLEQIEAQLLRDEFAKYALIGVLTSSLTLGSEQSAYASYKLSDAMLKERSK